MGSRGRERGHEGDKGERKKEKRERQCRRTEPQALKFEGGSPEFGCGGSGSVATTSLVLGVSVNSPTPTTPLFERKPNPPGTPPPPTKKKKKRKETPRHTKYNEGQRPI